MNNNIFYIVFFLLFFSCKKESSTNLTNGKIVENPVIDSPDQNLYYDEVLDLKKNADYNIDSNIQKLDVKYLSMSFNIRYISERAYISVQNGNNLLLDWKPIQINFYYDSSFINAENDIHLLLKDNDTSKGVFLFPAFTEQFSTYFVYYFKKNTLDYIGNYKNPNFNKGTFSFNEKTKQLYILSDEKFTLNKLEESESKNELPLEEIKKDIERIKDSNSEINSINKWIGKYSCNFLRIKEEYADPRAYGMIYINIDNNGAKFKLDTYKEIIDKDLIVLSCNSTEIILAERDNKNSKFTIIKNNKKIELKSDLLNNTVGDISTYKLIKNRP